MVIDNPQTYRNEEYISSRSCTLLSSRRSWLRSLVDCARSRAQPYRVCVKRNHITSRHLARRQSAKWFVFIIILRRFFTVELEAHRLYGQNSCFSDIIFRASQQFFIELERAGDIFDVSGFDSDEINFFPTTIHHHRFFSFFQADDLAVFCSTPRYCVTSSHNCTAGLPPFNKRSRVP